ncbi:MAG: nucleotidyltransferase family protein [Anaerolineae bacterium]|nr:nucleotidyltransferase family protein [Anaerolineae bacterium]
MGRAITMIQDSQQIEGIVLAAGRSSRCDPFKMTLLLGGKAVIARCVASMYGIVSRIVVVTGWNADLVREALRGYERVEFAHNAGFDVGMFSSVQTGVAQVQAATFFLTPGDYALLTPSVYETLLAAPGRVVIPTFQGQRGHPVLLRGLKDEILSAPAEATLREVIDQVGCVTVEVDHESILWDIDTFQDYERIKTYFD